MPTLIYAKRPGWCRVCGRKFEIGTSIMYDASDGKSAHRKCPEQKKVSEGKNE